MTKREAVARAIYKASVVPGVQWEIMAPATQSNFLCYADFALEAIEAWEKESNVIPFREKEPLKSMLDDEVPADFADKIEETVGDWHERNGLR